MSKITTFKGIKTSNIPSHNLREQFYNHYHMVKSQEFKLQITNWKPGKQIETPYVSWFYWPEQYFTFLTQMSVIGLESYMTAAMYNELGMRGLLKENIMYVKNPFSIKGERGTATKYFKLLPELLSEKISLPNCNKTLWDDVKVFYREVRNPLFHGAQLDKPDINDLINIFELLADIYNWIDSWHNPDKVIQGSSWFTKLN